MKTWVKLYTEINNDPKVIRLTWAQRGIWSALLALAGQIDEQDENGPTGCVGSLQDAALMIRCDEDEFTEAVCAFTERGMIHEDDGLLYLSQFAERQSRAPSSQREAVTERVKRYRRRKGIECNEDVTRVQRGVTPSDTDTDTESDTEGMAQSAPAATPPTTPEPQPEPVVAKKTNVRSDPRSKTPAIQCVYAICDKRYPPKALFDTIIATLGDKPDGPKLRRCRQEWVERGYNASSWKWLTEWYVTGIPPKNGTRNGGPPGYGRGKGGAVIETDLDVWRADAQAVAAGRG